MISYALRFLLLLMKMIAQTANIRVTPTGTTMMRITFVVVSSFFPGLVLLSLLPAKSEEVLTNYIYMSLLEPWLTTFWLKKKYLFRNFGSMN